MFLAANRCPPRIKSGAGSRIKSGAGSRIKSGAGSRIKSGAGSRIKSGAGSRIESGPAPSRKCESGLRYNDAGELPGSWLGFFGPSEKPDLSPVRANSFEVLERPVVDEGGRAIALEHDPQLIGRPGVLLDGGGRGPVGNGRGVDLVL